MRRLGWLITLWMVAVAVQGTAAAQSAVGDSVTGSGSSSGGLGFTFEIDAHSGPNGENPTGQVTFRFASTGDVAFNGPVTCLAVNGNFAILDVDTPQFHTVGLEVTDSPSGDLIRAIPRTGQSSCSPIGSAADFPVTSGDVVVVDAPSLPTSKEQCKNGGWRSFGVFRNQGDCVSFVATGGKNPPAGAKKP